MNFPQPVENSHVLTGLLFFWHSINGWINN